MVLLKEVNPRGFVFFTNYQSRKGQSLAAHPFAALMFFWPELERQVRVEGRVEKLDAAASDEYFASRPYTSRIGVWASEQSSVIADKSVLVKRAAVIWFFGGFVQLGYGVDDAKVRNHEFVFTFTEHFIATHACMIWYLK